MDPFKRYLWLGGSDEVEELNWKWVVDNSSIDLNFFYRHVEPNGSGGCLANHATISYWFDYSCSRHLAYICEIPMNLTYRVNSNKCINMDGFEVPCENDELHFPLCNANVIMYTSSK